MDEIDELIQSFDSADEAEKLGIVEELEDYAGERILPFYLKAVMDERGNDLARMEILKILPLREYKQEDQFVVGRAIIHVLENDPKKLVRSYAAMAMYTFMETPGALEAVSEVLLDQDEDESLRHNALVAIEQVGPTSQTIGILRSIKADPHLGKSAERLLNDWQQA